MGDQFRAWILALALLTALASVARAEVFSSFTFHYPEPGAAPLAEPPRLVQLQAAEEAPVIDAQLDDAAWQDAERFSGFVVRDSSLPAREQRRVRMSFDEQNLYVAVRLEKKPGYELKADTRTDGDTHMWKDDEIELFLDPGLNYETYYQLIVNASGNYCDLYHRKRWEPDPAAADPNVLHQVQETDPAWQSRIEFEVDQGALDDQWWTIEMRIPAAAFGLPGIPRGARWGLNVTSNNPRTEQLTNWVAGDWHNPYTYGQIVLGEPRLRAENISFGQLAHGTNLFHATFTNQQNQASDYRITTRVNAVDDDTLLSEHVMHFSLPPQERRTLGQTYHVPRSSGRAKVLVQVHDDQDTLLYQAERRTTGLRPILDLRMRPYGYFTSDSYVTGELTTTLGSVTLKQAELTTTLLRDDEPIARETQRLHSPRATFRIDSATLAPGRYQLQMKLRDADDQLIDETAAGFSVAQSPYPND